MSSHDLEVCLDLKSIHTLDCSTKVELKFRVRSCGEVQGGELLLRLTPDAGAKYMLGDRISLHLRGTP